MKISNIKIKMGRPPIYSKKDVRMIKETFIEEKKIRKVAEKLDIPYSSVRKILLQTKKTK